MTSKRGPPIAPQVWRMGPVPAREGGRDSPRGPVAREDGRSPLPSRRWRARSSSARDCFGASLAWRLAREGARVTLVDQFEPGDVRASSGGESRLIRSGHGADPGYTASARRARELWRELEAECGEELLVECGLTWFARREDGWEAATRAAFEAQGIPHAVLAPEDGAGLYPSWSPRRARLPPPRAGGRRAARAAGRACAGAPGGGARRRRRCAPGPSPREPPCGSRTAARWRATRWCGPAAPGWGGSSRSSRRSRPTRQELYFLAGGPAWGVPGVPAYVDYDRAFYGTGDLDGLGVKAAVDHDGPALDPDAPLPPASAGGEADAAGARRRALPGASRTPRSRAPRPAATSSPPTATSSPRGTRSTRPCGCWAAARATASSTAPPWPSAWRPACAAASRCPRGSALGPRVPGRSVRTAGGSR